MVNLVKQIPGMTLAGPGGGNMYSKYLFYATELFNLLAAVAPDLG